MAILKAASWPRAGKRIIKWGSTSSRACVDEFEFTGNLIIVCNSFPNTPDAHAVSSRSLSREINIGVEDAKEFLKAAAGDEARFPDRDAAKIVCDFLCARISDSNLNQVSYRTLGKGYELVTHNPDEYHDLLEDLVKAPPKDPKKFIKKLAKQNIRVKEQARQFEEETGLKRRTFFKYRKELNLS